MKGKGFYLVALLVSMAGNVALGVRVWQQQNLSQPLGQAALAAAGDRLVVTLRLSDCPNCFDFLGRLAAHPRLAARAEVLVLGVSREEAEDLQRRYGQAFPFHPAPAIPWLFGQTPEVWVFRRGELVLRRTLTPAPEGQEQLLVRIQKILS
ncbi:MAG: hypothetical protein NZ869_03490 [Thermoanaerobaculum sp.]|nr:hypothetical protein [Thermoanaerobaculum sp.]MCX7896060.1 hypothetical protein [Thermoanaerobaculum sp.]MDW7967514.1 hypothetical protein [Thermoanaerobaculum sp.]